MLHYISAWAFTISTSFTLSQSIVLVHACTCTRTHTHTHAHAHTHTPHAHTPHAHAHAHAHAHTHTHTHTRTHTHTHRNPEVFSLISSLHIHTTPLSKAPVNLASPQSSNTSDWDSHFPSTLPLFCYMLVCQSDSQILPCNDTKCFPSSFTPSPTTGLLHSDRETTLLPPSRVNLLARVVHIQLEVRLSPLYHLSLLSSASLFFFSPSSSPSPSSSFLFPFVTLPLPFSSLTSRFHKRPMRMDGFLSSLLALNVATTCLWSP